MKLFLYLSDAILPLLVLLVVVYGIVKKRNIYEDFIKGAMDGIQMTARMLPTLIGLMIAVGMLRASGFLDFVAKQLGSLFAVFSIPTELIPLALVKLISSSAATGLLLDLYKQYGPDSFLGMAASIMLSSTETIFYTMSIYFMSVKIKKTRYTLVGALTASIVGVIVSVFLSTYLM